MKLIDIIDIMYKLNISRIISIEKEREVMMRYIQIYRKEYESYEDLEDCEIWPLDKIIYYYNWLSPLNENRLKYLHKLIYNKITELNLVISLKLFDRIIPIYN